MSQKWQGYTYTRGFPDGSVGKESAYNAGILGLGGGRGRQHTGPMFLSAQITQITL